MSLSRRSAVCLAAIAASLATLVPAASAGTVPTAFGSVHARNTMPSDCTVTYDPYTVSTDMTCTARPATQKWDFTVDCILKYGIYIERVGTTVTGDGTSVASRCVGPTNWIFYVVS